jgi:hypothetical protein
MGHPRHAYVKNSVKNYQGPTTSRENAIFPIRFFKFQWDYDLNLGRYLDPELQLYMYLQCATSNFYIF